MQIRIRVGDPFVDTHFFEISKKPCTKTFLVRSRSFFRSDEGTGFFRIEFKTNTSIKLIVNQRSNFYICGVRLIFKKQSLEMGRAFEFRKARKMKR